MRTLFIKYSSKATIYTLDRWLIEWQRCRHSVGNLVMRHLMRHSMRHIKPRKTVFCYKLRVNWDKARIDDLGRQTVVDGGKEVRSRSTQSVHSYILVLLAIDFIFLPNFPFPFLPFPSSLTLHSSRSGSASQDGKGKSAKARLRLHYRLSQ